MKGCGVGQKRVPLSMPIRLTLFSFTINICIIPGKKSASWQLVAIVIGPKTMQGGKNDVKLPKLTQNQRKNSSYQQG